MQPKNTNQSKCKRRSRPVDFTCVKTTRDAPPRTKQRVLGIQEAPTYYPTMDQYNNLINYIQSIRQQAERYGIIKIVPPKEFKPNTHLNTEFCYFPTRVQQVNGMKGVKTDTAHTDYDRHLTKYWDLMAQNINHTTIVSALFSPYKLAMIVEQRGGYKVVCDQNLWHECCDDLGHDTEMPNRLRVFYEKIITPYAQWLASTPPEVRSSSLLDSSYYVKTPETLQDCNKCSKPVQRAQLLVCGVCDLGYHSGCLPPASRFIPINGWCCPDCLSGDDGCYGAKDDYEYSLSEFQAFDNKFKQDWFSKKNVDLVSEEECEEEFWRLVNNPQATCQVEYGFSTCKQTKFNSLLGEIPSLPGSLLSLITSDISKLATPRLYVGMCFAALYWHIEQHYTYSVDYMHYGDTKTWYGVPGAHASQFENAMQKVVPELFDPQSNYLFHMSTMLNPELLSKEGIPVFTIDQRPGELVITFPKAYHSGFNHGFNFCEKVNFATEDWLPFGLECAIRYQKYQQQPCFSLDSLLLNYIAMAPPLANFENIKNDLRLLRQREMDGRQRIIKQYPKLNTSIIGDSNQQLQCFDCCCYAYLSYISCSCNENRVACLDHINKICICPPSSKMMHMQLDDETLLELDNWDIITAKLSTWMKKTEIITAPDIKYNALHQQWENEANLLLNRCQLSQQQQQQQHGVTLDYHALVELLQKAEKYEIPNSNEAYIMALFKKHLGDIWYDRARRMLPLGHRNGLKKNKRHIVIETTTGKPRYMTLDDLNEIISVDQDIPIVQDIYQDLADFRHQISSWITLYENTMLRCKQPKLCLRPTIQEIRDLEKASRGIPPHIIRQETAVLAMIANEKDRPKGCIAKLQKRLFTYYKEEITLDELLRQIYTETQLIIVYEMKHNGNSGDNSIKIDNGGQDDDDDDGRFCICREGEFGYMVQCDMCEEWYHGECVNINKIKPKAYYTCPVCDHRFIAPCRPTFKEMCDVMDQAQTLSTIDPPLTVFCEIMEMMATYHDYLHGFLQSNFMPTAGYAKMINKHRRNLLGLPIDMADEFQLLTQKLHGIPKLPIVIPLKPRY
ncbi:JmjC domain, hydroxylase-domain-containing protein [Chlamydoabsidia padenii]|nr:JmjC domain, hydroxylase-domain-containing protein [Chlamydoabsidia padenii]